jgi:predicted small lipoprotein YifL
MRAAVVLVVALGLLAGCGKKGPPEPPGPPDQITYPKSYPTR